MANGAKLKLAVLQSMQSSNVTRISLPQNRHEESRDDHHNQASIFNTRLTQIPRAQSTINPSSRPSIICNQSPSNHQHSSPPKPTHQNPPTPPNMAFSQTICIPQTCAALSKRRVLSPQPQAAPSTRLCRSLGRKRVSQRNCDD